MSQKILIQSARLILSGFFAFPQLLMFIAIVKPPEHERQAAWILLDVAFGNLAIGWIFFGWWLKWITSDDTEQS